MISGQPSVGGALISLGMLVLLVFGLRLFLLWFFKINKLVAILASIDRKLDGRCDAEAERMMPSLAAFRERLKKLMPEKKPLD